MNMAQATPAKSTSNNMGSMSAATLKQMMGTNVAHDKAQNTGPTKEFLTFRLGAEEYGIDILRVQEIRSYEEPTRIANSPKFIKGVVNLRGVIVPVVDLRIKFNLPSVTYDQFTVVIILNVVNRIVGVVVDSVSDVLGLTPAEIKPRPEFGGSFDTDYLLGLATVGERMLILVDIEKLMTSSEMALVDATQA